MRFFAAVLLTIAATTATAGPDLVASLEEQLAGGDLAGARTTARELVAVRPDLAGAWYNLAGLEAQLGDLPRGEEAFARAVQLGFDDFRHADQDTDLVPLQQTPTYRQLRSAWRDGLVARSSARAVVARGGDWTGPIVLADRRGGLTPPEAELRLRADADGLEAEVLLGDEELPPTPPWEPGGSGLLVCVTLPDSTGEGRHHHDFGFGWRQRLPAGAKRVGDLWQPLAELSPKMRIDRERQRLRVTFQLPWSACFPLHPLVDEDLLFNVAYVRGHDENPGVAALLDDPGLGRSDRPWRRGVRLGAVMPDDEPAVAARIGDPVIRDGLLRLSIRAAGADASGARPVHVVLRDRNGAMVIDRDVAVGDQTLAVPRDVPAGSARLGVSLAAGGRAGAATWEQTLVLWPDDHAERLARRMAAAPAPERPSLAYRARAIDEALASRHRRADVSALATTVDELESMLAAVARTGTSLPAGGSYLALVDGPPGRPPLTCSLALPDGWQRGDDARVLLLLVRAPGAIERAIDRVPRLVRELAEGGPPPPIVLAIPHLPSRHDAAAARERATTLIRWLPEFLGADAVHVAGVDLLAATALEVAAADPQPIAGVLGITGVNFVPYPGQSSAEITSRFASLPADLPAGWIWFPDEVLAGDQARTMRDILREGDRELSPAAAIPGGLSFDQAWSRAVAWVLDGPEG